VGRLNPYSVPDTVRSALGAADIIVEDTMSYDISLRFYNSRFIGTPGSIEEIIAFFKRKNFRISDITVCNENNVDFHWDLYDPNEQLIVTAAYTYCGMNFRCFNDEEQLELTTYIAWGKIDETRMGDTFLAITTFQTALFTRQENDPAYFSDLFLEIGKHLFAVTNPDFGWMDTESFAGFTMDEDISSFMIPYTYWANFLGEGYVKKYGKEKLLSAPVWHSEILSPGGILLVLSPILGVHPGDTELLKNYCNSPHSAPGV